MKNVSMFLLTSLISGLFASVSFASSWSYDCGKTMNMSRTILVRTATKPTPHDYSLEAKYTTSGADATTHMIAPKTYIMDGQTDEMALGTNQKASVLAFLDETAPQFQLVVGNSQTVGQVVLAYDIDLRTKNVNKFKCQLTGFKK